MPTAPTITPLDTLKAYLDTRVDRSVLKNKAGSSERGGAKVGVNALEHWLLKRAVQLVATAQRYQL